ncbi:MAG: hypothetical protein IT373_32035 [Polyangiaceae bacterium]|nr:hypothetical protein [Polyangiaceae bacterium]
MSRRGAAPAAARRALAGPRRGARPTRAALVALGLALVLAGATACGPEVPPPRPLPTAHHAALPEVTAEPATPAPATSASAAPSAGTALDLAWVVDTGAHNKAVSLAPWGDVVALGSRRLSVHARTTGAEILAVDACFTFADAIGFVGDELAVVCEDGVELYSFAAASWRAERKIPGHARAAAFAPGRLAVGSDDGKVRLYDTGTWREERSLEVGAVPTALALSADGRRLAVALEERDGFWVDLPAGSGEDGASPERHAVHVPPGPAIGALALTADGHLLFAAGGPRAALLDLERGTTRAVRLVGGVATARFATPAGLVTAGADGVLWVDAEDGSAHSIGGGVSPLTGERYDAEGTEHVGLALDAGGRLLCAGAESGKLACYAHVRIDPAQPFAYGTARAATTTGGRVMTFGGRRATVKALPREPLPAAGAHAHVLRYSERREGELTLLEWTDVGAATVDAVDKDVLRLTLTDKLDALPYDTQVRISWAR